MKLTIAIVLITCTVAAAAEARPRRPCVAAPTARQQQLEAAADRFNERSLTSALDRAGLTRIALQAAPGDGMPPLAWGDDDGYQARADADQARERGWIPFSLSWDERLPAPPSAPTSALFALDREGRLLRVRLMPVVKARQRLAVCCVGGALGADLGRPRTTMYYIPPGDKPLAGEVTLRYPAHAVSLVGPTCLPMP